MKYLKIFLILSLCMLSSCSTRNIASDTDTEKIHVDRYDKDSAAPAFVLGEGDEVALNVWRNDDLKRTIKVDPSGNIYVPLAGEIHASGLNLFQLRERITLKLSKYIVDPQVDVNITKLESRRIYILGEVKSPGSVSLNHNMPAWEAVSLAGGFTDDADKKNILIIRSINGTARVSTINFNNMLKQGNVYREFYLRKGDVIYALPSVIASIEKFMLRLNNIITPIVNLERGIILGDDAVDVLNGKKSRGGVIVAP